MKKLKLFAGIVGLILFMIFMVFLTKEVSKTIVVEKQFFYSGENERWSAECKIDAEIETSKRAGMSAGNIEQDLILTVTYKNDISELADVKHMKISYTSMMGGAGLDLDFQDKVPDQKQYVLTSKVSTFGLEYGDEPIELTIDMDGKVEVIQLDIKAE